MKDSFSIKFVLNPIKESNTQGKIYIRIIVNRKKAEIATEHIIHGTKPVKELGKILALMRN